MQHDTRAHAKMTKTNLAYKNLISYHQIPILNEDDSVELKAWPMILPESMATALHAGYLAQIADLQGLIFVAFRSSVSCKLVIETCLAMLQLNSGKSWRKTFLS